MLFGTSGSIPVIFYKKLTWGNDQTWYCIIWTGVQFTHSVDGTEVLSPHGLCWHDVESSSWLTLYLLIQKCHGSEKAQAKIIIIKFQLVHYKIEIPNSNRYQLHYFLYWCWAFNTNFWSGIIFTSLSREIRKRESYVLSIMFSR